MGKQTKNNSKVVLHFIAIVLTVVTIVSLALGLFAWSKYTANQSGNATAPVAKWNFNLSLKSGTTSVTGNNSLDLATTLDEPATHVANGKIAPGTSGTFDIEIDTLGTEVAMFYDVTIGMTNCPRNITFSKKGPGESGFTVISAAKTGDESERTRTVNFSKYLTLNDITTANTNETKFVETIKWDWPYELTGNDPATNQPYTAEQKTAYDLRDNADQGQTVTINITAVGTEVMNAPLTTATISYEEQDSLRNGDTISAYKGETTQININNNTENVTFSSSDPSVVKIDADGKVTGIEEGEAIITITGQETGKVVSLNVKTKLAIRATINGESKLLSEDNIGLYYGSVVSNYTVNGKAYQLFFIDYEGKYGEKGGIYLKQKDNEPNTALTISNKSVNLPEMLIDEMNPEWKVKKGYIGDKNEKAVAWLCDTTQWETYATPDDTSLQSKVKYAIGGPSIEMYVDSYNKALELYNKANNTNLSKISCSYTRSDYGYQMSGSIDTNVDRHRMYWNITVPDDKYWIASHGRSYMWDPSGVVISGGQIMSCTNSMKVAPLVCLQSDFSLELLDTVE